MHTIHYTVDGEPQTTDEHQLTPTQILNNSQIDPATHYLVLVEGNHKHSYENTPGEIIHMHERMKFVSIFRGPTPVSQL